MDLFKPCNAILRGNWKLMQKKVSATLTVRIPGNSRIVPTTGTRLKKFTATGKKPLKTKECYEYKNRHHLKVKFSYTNTTIKHHFKVKLSYVRHTYDKHIYVVYKNNIDVPMYV